MAGSDKPRLGTFMSTITLLPTRFAVTQDGEVATILTANAFGAKKVNSVDPLLSQRSGFSLPVTVGGFVEVYTPKVIGSIFIVPEATTVVPLQPGPFAVNV